MLFDAIWQMGMEKKFVNINEFLFEGGTAFVNVNDKVSSLIQIQKRVYQGWCLVPYYFFFIIGDMFSHMVKATMHWVICMESCYPLLEFNKLYFIMQMTHLSPSNVKSWWSTITFVYLMTFELPLTFLLIWVWILLTIMTMVHLDLINKLTMSCNGLGGWFK